MNLRTAKKIYANKALIFKKGIVKFNPYKWIKCQYILKKHSLVQLVNHLPSYYNDGY